MQLLLDDMLTTQIDHFLHYMHSVFGVLKQEAISSSADTAEAENLIQFRHLLPGDSIGSQVKTHSVPKLLL